MAGPTAFPAKQGRASGGMSAAGTRQLYVGALSQDTARAANEPSVQPWALASTTPATVSNACALQMWAGNRTANTTIRVQGHPHLPTSVLVVRLLSEVVRHDVGANRGRTFQTTRLAWRNI